MNQETKTCVTENCVKPRWGGHLRCHEHRFFFTEKDWEAMMPAKSGERGKCIDCDREFDLAWINNEDCLGSKERPKGQAQNHRISENELYFT